MIGCDCEVCCSQNVKDKRLRSSILVSDKSTTLVVDAGPDFRQQMLAYEVKTLDAVLLTHSHKDHIGGIDDVRAYNYFQQQPMLIYGSGDTLSRVQAEYDYAFTEHKYPGVPSVILQEVADNPFTIGDLVIQPIPAWHFKMPVLGYRFGDFTYITDANRIEEASKNLIRGSSVLVINALRHAAHISHFTLSEAIALADELEIAEVYFTHLSHQMGLYSAVENDLPAGRHLAYDGLVLTI